MKVSLLRKSFSFQEGGSFPLSSNFYTYTVFTTGWNSGTRNRARSFADINKLFGYLNKLRAGGWLSDVDYDEAWCIALELDTNFSEAVRMKGVSI